LGAHSEVHKYIHGHLRKAIMMLMNEEHLL